MSVRSYTFDEVRRRFQSIAGIESMTAADEFFFENSLNRAAYRAYGMSDAWPRYIVVGEERDVISDNVVKRIEGGKNNIEEFIKIHKRKPYFNQSEIEFDFYIDSNGANLINAELNEQNTAFVTYKREWDGPYNYQSSSIPGEFLDFIIHSCLSDFYQGDGQSENSRLEEQRAQSLITEEIMKVEKNKNRNIFGTRFNNHLSRQSR